MTLLRRMYSLDHALMSHNPMTEEYFSVFLACCHHICLTKKQNKAPLFERRPRFCHFLWLTFFLLKASIADRHSATVDLQRIGFRGGTLLQVKKPYHVRGRSFFRFAKRRNRSRCARGNRVAPGRPNPKAEGHARRLRARLFVPHVHVQSYRPGRQPLHLGGRRPDPCVQLIEIAEGSSNGISHPLARGSTGINTCFVWTSCGPDTREFNLRSQCGRPCRAEHGYSGQV
jgi:hypothetical protein